MNVICNFIEYCADFPNRCETCPCNRLSMSYLNENIKQMDFEAGVAFTLRHLTDNEHNVIDISKFVGEISNLRTWKSAAEWDDFVKRNIVEDNYG